MRRLIVFAHFDRDNLLDPYVAHYLQQLRPFAAELVFVSTSRIAASEQRFLGNLCSKVIERENIGYDFMSWQVGLQSVANLKDYDEVVICNDSVYGPIFPLEEMFHEMEKRRCDFWGITDNRQITFHLMSYFLAFRREVVASSVFQEFWEGIAPQSAKFDVILKYEIGLSTLLISKGFQPAAYFKPDALTHLSALGVRARFAWRLLRTLASPQSRPKGLTARGVYGLFKQRLTLNSSQCLWRDLIRRRVPLIKIELIRDDPYECGAAKCLQAISKYSAYPRELIEQHQRRLKR